MLKNYLKITFRNLFKHKAYSFINIFGLAVGMTCTILILLWVQDEMSYDKFHKNTDNLYRVIGEYQNRSSGELLTTTYLPAPLAAQLKEEVPEIVNAARWSADQRDPLMFNDKRFYEDGISSIDPAFLEMFSFPFIYGNAQSSFPDKRSVVITEAIAKKYFDDDDPIGKVINWNNWQDYTVRGVIKNVPKNSHIQFNFLRTFEIEKESWPGGFTWTNWNRHIYVQLVENSNVYEINQKMRDVLIKNHPGFENRPDIKLFLEPLSDIHFSSGHGNEYADVRDIKYVYIYSLIAFFMLLIACINFMNLSTARSVNRSKEVGMRKAVGANRRQIITQFLGESILLAVMATMLAIVLTEIFLPSFNSISGKQLTIDYFSVIFILKIIGLVLITGILAGSYPAVFLSSFKPIHVLKGKLKSGKGGSVFRKALVAFQFSISILLIFITVVVFNQLNFISAKNLGFEKENVVYIPIKDNMSKKYEVFKNELVSNPNILSVSTKGQIPTTTSRRHSIRFEGEDIESGIAMDCARVGYSYFQTLSMKLIEGRTFSKNFPTDVNESFVLNEEAAIQLGAVLGQKISVGDRAGKIIGIVKNAHLKSLHHQIDPQVYYFLNDIGTNEINLTGVILIKIKGDNIPETFSTINKKWDKINSAYPLEISFLDKTYERLYHSERQIKTIFSYFAILSIIISALGLFGLSSFSTEQRTKEIGVRKVLGASVLNIVRLLSKEFIILVCIGNIIAWPVAYYAMNSWLQNFAYRTEIGWWIFLLSGSLALFIALITVSSQAIKAALANPVESLRYE